MFFKLDELGFNPTVRFGSMFFEVEQESPSGEPTGKMVQVDFLRSRNLAFTKFKRYSSAGSKYKGEQRAILLAAIIKAVTKAVADDATDREEYVSKAGKKYPASRYKRFSITDDGVMEVTKDFMGKRGFRKNAEEDKTKRRLVTSDPQEMLDIVFGEGKYNAATDLESFETIWQNILLDPSFPYADKRDDIILGVFNGINEENEKREAKGQPVMAMPDELSLYVYEHRLNCGEDDDVPF